MATIIGLTSPQLSIIGMDRHALPARLTCKAVSSCEEAVQLWCGGYRGADWDKDRIPCENMCTTREQVQEIQESIAQTDC